MILATENTTFDQCTVTVSITKAEAKPVAMEVFCSYSYGPYMDFDVAFVSSVIVD